MLSIRKHKYRSQEYSSLAGECFFSTNPFSVPGSLPLYAHNDFLSDFNIKLRKDKKLTLILPTSKRGSQI